MTKEAMEMEGLPFEPMVETPSQYADARRARFGAYDGERRLWLAVAEMAIKDWLFATEDQTPCTFAGWDRRNRDSRRQRLRQELEEWLTETKVWPGSLEWLSEVLGMDAGQVRRRLLSGKVIELPRAAPRKPRNAKPIAARKLL